MALNYCTRLAIVKRTGDAEGMDVAFCGFSVRDVVVYEYLIGMSEQAYHCPYVRT